MGVPPARGLCSLLPLLVLALAFPFSTLYEPAVASAAAGITRMGEEAYENYRALGLQGGALGDVAVWLHQATEAWVWLVRHLLPALLFAWSGVLVAMAVLLARRLGRAVGRPLPGPEFAQFRLPEGAVWLLLIGLAIIATRRPELQPSGINLALCMALGYCLQGIAVVDFALLARGFQPGIIWILFLFVAFFALPLLVLTTTGLGLADIWLDWRQGPSRPGVKKMEA
jgi:hypothetical protein